MDVDHYSKQDVLKDGSPVLVRAVRPEDKDAIQNALKHLSADSAYARFFYPKRKFTERELKFFTELDLEKHVALGVGLIEGEDTLPIGIGRYIVEKSETTRAEVALTVADEFQGLGVGTMLLNHLASIARDRGINEFIATILNSNERMLHVFRHSNLPMKQQSTDGVVEVRLSLISKVV